MKTTIRFKLISIVSILVLVVLGLTATQSVNAWRQRSAAVQFGDSEAAASAVLEAGSLMAVERGTTNAVLAAAQIDPAQRANATRAREAAAAGLAAALERADAAGLNTAEAKAALRQLETVRQTAWAAIDGNGKREPGPWFGSATRAIEAVLVLAQRVGEILPSTAEARLADSFTLTGNLAEIAEYMGRERGLVAGIIAGGKPLTSLQTELLGRAEGAVTVSGISAQIRSARLGPEFEKAMTPVKAAFERMNGELARIVDASNNAAAYPMDSATWFKTASVLIEDVLAARRGVEELIRKDINTFQHSATDTLLLNLALILACATVAVAAFWIVGRQVIRPLDILHRAVSRFAHQDYSPDVPYIGRQDELGAMARAIDVLKANSVEAQRLRERQELERVAANQQKRAALEYMASKVETETRSAVDQVALRTNAMDEHASSMAESADRVIANSQDVAAAAEQALSNAETVASAVEQLTASIREIATQVSHGNTVSNKAVEKSEYTQRTISTLSDAITRIGEVVTLISEIAAQTNLLALNATIEAARAGDAGKGFAVVANEVKNLAGQTAKATEEIGRQIDEIQSVSHTAVAAVKEIDRTIGEMDEISGAIATAIEEQGAATQEIGRNVVHAAQASREVSARIFDVSKEAASTGERVATVRAAATEVADAIAELRNTLVQVVRTSTAEVDRRELPRFAVAQACTLTVGSRAMQATIANMSEGGALIAGADALPAGAQGRLAVKGLGLDVQFTVVEAGPAGLRIRFADAQGDHDRIHAALESYGTAAA
jgi:methyl-accepting chemotaxis protein